MTKDVLLCPSARAGSKLGGFAIRRLGIADMMPLSITIVDDFDIVHLYHLLDGLLLLLLGNETANVAHLVQKRIRVEQRTYVLSPARALREE